MLFTVSQFATIFPRASDAAYGSVLRACQEFGISTPQRVAAFLAQIHHESAGLTELEESFHYSPKRLMEVWPFRFRTLEKAKAYAGRPQEIANYVYSKRMGNGPESSGDGWRFRGRGPIQLTGRGNYREFGEAMSLPFETTPSLVAEIEFGARVAARFWKIRGCNEFADRGDFVGVTRMINGGTNGLKQRREIFASVQGVIAQPEQRVA